MKKLNKNFLVGATIILIIGVGVLLFGIFKSIKNENLSNVNVPNVDSLGEAEYKVNIDAKDCLTKEEANELIDWGEYKDNEKMIYIDNNQEHPIQVWKIKLKEGQDKIKITQILMKNKNEFIEQITDDELMQEMLMGQYGSKIGVGGDVLTMIISNHLEEANEQTKNWLKN